MHPFHFKLAFGIGTILIGITPYSSWLQTSFSVLVTQNPEKPPDKDPPPGRRVRGGDLDPTNPNCKKTSQPLTAIVPANSLGTITSERLTLWFYVPYTSEDITSTEFSVLNRDETDYVYQTQFMMPKIPGIVSISLPLSAKNSLETGNFYRWYLKFKCKGSTSNAPDIETDGWVKRIASTPITTNQINTATPEIWYDAVNNLANRLLASPQDTKLKQEWTDLLKSVGLSNLAQEPLTGPVIISK
ncbi:MAG: DUF928 domain-containing protein [Tychonema bourrellyi B0820]|uniref:DUF928 domain-containing protein n=1 Tax=Tychonema bourrellyi FEM_GT703 TaxID=2040638 RepID=A0A2G4F502_9CYAN|nr:DUF928 domain-containing protein [Tychonema bourrellyi]MDQ2100001.1 DUF928 domain-containing protein [Tychonema bourrellyi B0820]PHX56830.1 DUF928 domain-containing protein [Tychonema bourrellyi FEM_GT703]